MNWHFFFEILTIINAAFVGYAFARWRHYTDGAEISKQHMLVHAKQVLSSGCNQKHKIKVMVEMLTMKAKGMISYEELRTCASFLDRKVLKKISHKHIEEILKTNS